MSVQQSDRARLLGLSLLLVVFALAPAPPEVVRVKVPSTRVGSWFPKGSELVSMSVADFDELIRKVRESAEHDRVAAPGLLRAVHRARWVEGELVGETTFTVRRGSKAGSIPLTPFNLTLDAAEGPDFQVGATDRGDVSLSIPPVGPNEITVHWRRQARSSSQGRSFTLELPYVALASLELDLPEDLRPELFSVIPPTEGRATSGRTSWRSLNASGKLEIRLGKVSEERASTRSLPWISGPTTIDVGPVSANWQCEWSVDLNGRRDPLSVNLSDGLELSDVSGPGVESFQASTSGGHGQVKIQFRREVISPTTVVIRAVGALPAARSWVVPSARPEDGVWLGGTTTVRLDPSHGIESCRVLQGRRIAPRSTDPAERTVLVFEPERPEPPAELTFVDNRPLYGVEVHGFVQVSTSRTRLSAELRWTFAQGRVSDLAFEIPNEWSIEQVSQDQEPLPWHQETAGQRPTLVKVHVPPLETGSTALTIHVDAIRKASPSDEGIELPRIKPVEIPIADEVWGASADGGRVLVPRVVQGLVWVDPSIVKTRDLRPEITVPSSEHRIAWRWTGEEGRLVAAVVAAPRETKSIIEGRTVIAKGRMRTDWRITIQPGTRPIAFVPLFWTTSPAGPTLFRLTDPQGRTQDLETRSMTATERAESGFPRDHGSAFAVLLPGRTTEILSLQVAIDRPWASPENVPLLSIADSYHPRAQVGLEVEPNLLLHVDPTGMEEIEAEEKQTPETGTSGGGIASRLRSGPRFRYRTADPQLRLTTSPAERQSAGIVVTSARLNSILSESGALTQRLVMVVRCTYKQSLTLKMPEEARIDRVVRDGEDVAVSRKGTTLAIPLTLDDGTSVHRLVIDYGVRQGPAADESQRLDPRLPIVDAPCLRFSWRVVLPGHLTAGRHGEGLRGEGPPGASDSNPLLTWGSPVAFETGRIEDLHTIKTLSEALNRVDQELRANPKATLSDFLFLLDAGSTPILIDTIGLDDVSLTPRSPFAWEPGETWKNRDGPARLERGELCLIPFGDAFLLSNRNGRLTKSLETRSFVREVRSLISSALIHGVEPSGRFQSVDVWSEEGDAYGARGEQGDAWLPGSSEAVFRCHGWPTTEAWFELDRPFRQQEMGLLLAISVLVAGVLAHRLSARWRPTVLGLLMALAIGSLGLGSFINAWIRVGLCVGALGIVLMGLVSGLRKPSRPTPLSERSTRSLNPRSVSSSRLGTWLPFVLMIGAGTSLSARDEAVRDEPIVVLLPYEGAPSLDDPATRVVLRLSDLQRLRAVIDPETRPATGRVVATESSHHLSFNDQQVARLTSEYRLVIEGAEPVEWRVPTDDAWEIHATVDDHDHPIRMTEEGRVAVLVLSGEGKHQLKFDRAVKSTAEGTTLRCNLAITPVAMSRVEIESPPDRTVIELEGGLTRPRSRSGRLEGDVGPVQTLRVEFKSSDPKVTGGLKPGFSGLALWDARPSGDLVRLRLTVSQAEPVTSLKLSLEAGTQIRLADARRLTDDRWEQSSSSTEWLGTFDPPYRRGEEISLELWRPVAPINRLEREASVRRSPSVSIPGASSFSGVIAFRRPGDWSGRLRASSGFDALDEESFVRAWGTLPDEPLTLAGVRAFQNQAVAAVATGPTPLRRTVRPSLKVELGEGRLDVLLEAEVKDERGQSTDLDLEISPLMILDQFSVDGLATLSRPKRGRLHADLKPIEVASRKLVLRGHLTIASGGGLAEGRLYQSQIPWPIWPDATEQPGLLTLVTAVKPQFVNGPGVASLAIVDGIVPGSQFPMFRKVYQVSRSADLGLLSWQAAPPEVAAYLLSRLTIDETTLRLESTIRYASTGGSVDVLYLKLPTVWAQGAEIELVGESVQRTTETRGEWTFWTLRPEHPIWGAARLVLRSVRDIPFGEAFAYPDLVPLGQGSVEKILSIERRAAAPVEIEGSSGLQSIDFSRLNNLELVDPENSRIDSYRVKGDSWGLNLRVEGDRRGKKPPYSTVVRTVDILCHIDRDGSSRGCATLVVDGRRGTTLTFNLANDAEVIGCSVDRRPVIALSEKPGSWCIPIESHGDSLVEILWSSPATQTPLRAHEVDFPRFSDDVPTLVRVFADPRVAVDGIDHGMEEIKSPLWMLERTDRVARRIVGLIARFDRSSDLQEKTLRSLLTQFERDEQQTRRSSQAFSLGNPEATLEFRDQIKARLARTREVVIESLVINGLDDLRDHLSPSSMNSPATTREYRDNQARQSGFFSYGETLDFRSATGGPGHLHTLEWSVRPESSWSKLAPAFSLTLAGIAIVATPRVIRARVPKSRLLAWGLVVGLVILTVFAPMPGVILLAACAIGSSLRDNDPRPATTIL